MSYNIRNIEDGDSWNDDDLNFEYTDRNIYVLNAIKAENPDVLGLQEACTKKSKKLFANPSSLSWFSTLEGANGLTQNGYSAYRGLSAQGAGSDKETFNAIYYKTAKFNFIAGGTERIYISAINDTNCANWVVLECKESGQRFLFINTHLPAHWTDEDRAARVTHATELLEKIDTLKETHNYPVILVGDFNEKATHPACKLIRDDGFANSLSVASIKVNNNTGTYAPSFATINDDSPIDHIFTKDLPQDAYISYYETVENKHITGSVGKYPSDHLPVVAYVEFPIIH